MMGTMRVDWFTRTVWPTGATAGCFLSEPRARWSCVRIWICWPVRGDHMFVSNTQQTRYQDAARFP